MKRSAIQRQPLAAYRLRQQYRRLHQQSPAMERAFEADPEHQISGFTLLGRSYQILAELSPLELAKPTLPSALTIARK